MAHIGILTGGGDVPGLNSVIKSVDLSVLRARLVESPASGAAGRG